MNLRVFLPEGFPKIVCLAGSTRFSKAFADALLAETLAGKICLTVGSMTHSDAELKITDEQKKALDALHLKKVEMADEVFVLNVLLCKECGSESYPNYEFLKQFKGGTLKMTYTSGDHTCDHQPYIGESTRNEIRHALSLGKPVRFLNDQLVDQALWDQIKPKDYSTGYPITRIPAGKPWTVDV